MTNKIKFGVFFLVFFVLGNYVSFSFSSSKQVENPLETTNLKANVVSFEESTKLLKTSDTFIWNWDRRLGVSGSPDYGESLVTDSKGYIYATGKTHSYGAGAYDIFLVKYNRDGLQIWNRTWGGNESDGSRGLAIDTADNLYIAGHTESFGEGISSMVLIKYDENGEQQWNITRSGGANDVILDSMGNIYVAGTIGTPMNTQIILVKFNANGEEQWNRTWGGGDFDVGNGVFVDSSDSVYLVGDTVSFGEGDLDMVLIKYDQIGEQQWNRTWGGFSSDVCNDVIVDAEDQIYMTGSTYSFGEGNSDFVLVKYDMNGIQQWNRTLGTASSEQCKGIGIDTDNNIYLTGNFHDELVLVKYNRNGEVHWNITWSEEINNNGNDVTVGPLNTIYIVGYVEVYGSFDNEMILLSLTISDDTNNTPNTPNIPGYDLYLFFIVLIVISTILIKKQINLKNKLFSYKNDIRYSANHQ